MKPHRTTAAAYKLLLDGAVALARVEAAGIRVDKGYLDKAIFKVQKSIDGMTKEMHSDKEVFPAWKKQYGRKLKLSSRTQLADVLFDVLGQKSKGETKSGRKRTDKEALELVELPFVRTFVRCEEYKKALSTYLIGLRREAVETPYGWFVHPSFNLNTVISFRSCIAKGTLIEVVRDVSKNPKGVPIEAVRKGDYVYCYNDQLNLTIKKVLWSGKTGTRKVVRLHWAAIGKRGHLDVTPEHRIRLSSGKYVQARFLTAGADFRGPKESKKSPRIRTLAMGRVGDRLFQTGKLESIHDHRLVYSTLIGSLKDHEVVHHVDRNHLNNIPTNLEKHTKQSHARLHQPETLTAAARRRGVLERNRRLRIYGYRGTVGKQHPCWKEVSKFTILRQLASVSGKVTEVRNSGYMDFDTFKRKAREEGINLKEVKDRYDGNGDYVTRGRLLQAAKQGIAFIKKEFRINLYKAWRMIDSRNISVARLVKRPASKHRTWNNHRITKLEWLDTPVDVYDIEVEDSHNFIANEICVHNSSSNPNFQNQPARNPEIAEMIRQCYIPRKGRHIGEIDYGQIEVGVPAAITGDAELRRYFTDPTTDMHTDQACAVFILPREEINRKTARSTTKNNFVFASFYGAAYQNCARRIWEDIDRFDIKTVSGVPMKKHFRKHGIKELGDYELNGNPPRPGTFVRHMKKCQDELWRRFSGYANWKEATYQKYLREGGLTFVTGFAFNGIGPKNEVTNYPIQGPAFHCTLWSLIQIVNRLRQYKFKSKVIGEIHDSLQLDIVPSELNDVVDLCVEVMTKELLDEWSWITVPLKTSVEISPVNKSWFSKKEWFKNSKGNWGLPMEHNSIK